VVMGDLVRVGGQREGVLVSGVFCGMVRSESGDGLLVATFLEEEKRHKTTKQRSAGVKKEVVPQLLLVDTNKVTLRSMETRASATQLLTAMAQLTQGLRFMDAGVVSELVRTHARESKAQVTVLPQNQAAVDLLRREVHKLAKRQMQEWTSTQLSDAIDKMQIGPKRERPAKAAKAAPQVDGAALQKALAATVFPPTWKSVLQESSGDKVRM
jgi:hypothetical protein